MFYLFRRHEKKVEKQAKKKGVWESMRDRAATVLTLQRKKETVKDADDQDKEKSRSGKKASSVHIEVAGEESIVDESSKAKLSPKSHKRTESVVSEFEQEIDLQLPPQDKILP